jgi:inner membrane protein
MLVLAHTGITLGAATLLAGAVQYRHEPKISRISWFASLSRYIDIRILLIGSLLPDIIDKPVGQYFFRETFSYGRIYAHTLLFLVIITAVGFYLYKSYNKVWLLTLAFGTFIHLILDEMWLTPRTLFWPFLGFAFDRADLTDWLLSIWQTIFRYPEVFIPELVGLSVLLWFGITIIVRKRVGTFIRYGKSY